MTRFAPLLSAVALGGCLGPWDSAWETDPPEVDPTALHRRCNTLYPADLQLPVDPAATYLIGTVFDHSLDTHVARYRSAQLAAIQANANGGLEGRSFAMIHCTNEENENFDDLDKTTASVETATWLAEVAAVPAIVGPAASSRTEAVYNAVADAFDTLVISPSATSPSLTPLDGIVSTEEDPGLLWRTAPPDDIQGAAIAWDMVNNFDPAGVTAYRTAPAQDVAVIYQTGAYGEGLEATFTSAFVAEGGQSTGFPFADETARADAIADVANGAFDEVLFISSDSSDVVAFLLGIASLSGFDDLPVFLTDSARNADVLSETGPAQGRYLQIRGTGPAQPSGPVYDSFAVTYASEYGGADVSVFSFTAQSFDAAWLVMMGHAWAFHQRFEIISGTNIARGLRRMSAGDPVAIRPTNWNLVKAAFESGASVDVEGASGQLDFDAAGETTAPIDVWTIAPSNDDFIVQSSFTL